MHFSKRGFGLFGLLIILGLVMVGGGAYWYISQPRPLNDDGLYNHPPSSQAVQDTSITTTKNGGVVTTTGGNTKDTAPHATFPFLSTDSAAETYVDPVFGFSVIYPKKIDPENRGGYLSTTFTLQHSEQGPASVGVTGSGDTASCYSVPADLKDTISFNGSKDEGVITVNSIVFKSYSTGEAASGHIVHTQVYNAVYGNTCYTIRTVLNYYTHAEGYTDPNSQVSKDIDSLTEDINTVVQSFKLVI